MSQNKSKLKDEVDQPKLTEIWDSPKPPRVSTGGEHKSRSRSVKRKCHIISPTSECLTGNKRQNLEKMATGSTPKPDKLKQPTPDEEALSKLDQMVVTAIKLLLQPIRDDVKDLLDSHNEIKTELGKLNRLREDNTRIQTRVEAVEKKNRELASRWCSLENRLLETSMVISGIQESPWETEAVRQEKLFIAFTETIIGRSLDDRLETARSMYIKGTKRIGIFKTMKVHPIIVEFMYKADAEYILNNKKYLGEGIYADRAHCKETEDTRRILQPYWKAAKKNPEYRHKCKLEEGTLIVKGLSYTVEDLHKLPMALSGFNISSTNDDFSFGYFRYMNPFSNFHLARFNLDGKQFHCSEQFIQYAKAKFFNCEDVANRILNCTECYRGIEVKFHQNSVLQKMLLETGNKTIVECCTDTLWGNGIPLQDENCLERRRWSGQGIMGEILEEIRGHLNARLQENHYMESDATSVTEPARGAAEINVT